MKILNLFLFFCLFATNILAQNNLKILLISGKIYKEGQSNELKAGDCLSKHDLLKTDSNSYLLLTLNDSVPIELYGKSTYDLANISTDFLYPKEYCQQALNILKTDMREYAKPILLKLGYGVPTLRAKASYLFGKKLTLKKSIYRDYTKENMNFRLLIKAFNLEDFSDTVMLDSLVQDSTVVLDIDKFLHLRTYFDINKMILSIKLIEIEREEKIGNDFFWDHKVILLYEKANEDNITMTYLMFNDDFFSENDRYFKNMPASPFNKVMEALHFEKHDLFWNAINSFEEAIQLAPNMIVYKQIQEAFFRRHVL